MARIFKKFENQNLNDRFVSFRAKFSNGEIKDHTNCMWGMDANDFCRSSINYATMLINHSFGRQNINVDIYGINIDYDHNGMQIESEEKIYSW